MTKTTTKPAPRAKASPRLSPVGKAVAVGMFMSCFDSKTRSDAGVPCPLTNPRTGEDSGVAITVHGMDSERFRVAIAEQARQVMEIRSKNGDVPLTEDETREQTLSLLASCTSGFVNLLTDDGEPLAHSHEAAKEFFRRSPSARREVDIFLANRANFLAA